MIKVDNEIQARGDVNVFVHSMSPPGPHDHVVLRITDSTTDDHVAHVLADDLIRAVRNAVNTGRVE